MGLTEMTTTTYVVTGSGPLRSSAPSQRGPSPKFAAMSIAMTPIATPRALMR